MNELTINKFQKGSQKAFQQIFNELYPALCLFSNKFLSNRDEAEDTVQEVFIELWNQHHKFTSFDHVKSFLYLTIRNKSLNIIKHAKIRDKYATEEFGLYRDEAYFEDQLIKSEVTGQIFQVIEKLPEQRRKIVLLNMEGLNNNEIAEDLGISVNTVKLQKKIAYKYLREQLGKLLFLMVFI